MTWEISSTPKGVAFRAHRELWNSEWKTRIRRDLDDRPFQPCYETSPEAGICSCKDGDWSIVQGLEVNDFSRGKMEATEKELAEERDAVSHLLP